MPDLRYRSDQRDGSSQKLNEQSYTHCGNSGSVHPRILPPQEKRPLVLSYGRLDISLPLANFINNLPRVPTLAGARAD
jgi:hypothetical protein